MGRPQTLAHIEEGIRNDYLSGMSAPAVADKWGVGSWVVYSVLKRAAIPRRTQSDSHMGQKNVRRVSRRVEQAVCKAYESGASRTEIAKTHGLSDSGVDQILSRNKVTRRRKPKDRSKAHHQDGRRECGKCHRLRIPDQFPVNGLLKDGLDSWCNICHASASRRHALKKYGLTIEDYEAMLKAQNYQCAICRREAKLCIDHCHVTGQVRGLLCKACNLGIGNLQDDPAILRTAVTYLEKHIAAKPQKEISS